MLPPSPSPRHTAGTILIDKLALTVPITDPAAQFHLLDALSPLGDYAPSALHAGRLTRAYEHGRHSHLTNNAHASIQASPRRPGAAFSRIEFNPSKAGPEGMQAYHQLATRLFPTSYALTACVTRIDIAIDFFGVSIADFNVRSTRHRKTMTVSGSRGLTETIYLGLAKSKTQVILYDKARQLRETEGSQLKGFCTRIEARIRTFTPVVQLGEIKNPFAGIKVYSLADITPPDARHWPLFRGCVAHRGLHAALALLPLAEREKYQRALAERPSRVWNPNDLWCGWPAAVEALGFSTSTPKPDLGVSHRPLETAD
jgi:hypothetical protein